MSYYEKMSYDQKSAAAKEIGSGIARICIMSGEDETSASDAISAYWSTATSYDLVDELLYFLRNNPYATTNQLSEFFHKEIEKAKARKKEEIKKKLKIGLIIAAVAVVAILILAVIF